VTRGARRADLSCVPNVETALAEALRLAAEAERWEIVGQLAEELAARRRRRGGLAVERPRATRAACA